MPVEEINGTLLHYEVAGRGEPLVLVHGAWVDCRSWDPVVPALADSFHVVSYDLRGHGQSVIDPPDAGTVHDDVADLVALIERLDLGEVNVAGISSGACIALRFACEHPAMVRRVMPHEPPIGAFLADDPESQELLDEIGEMMGAVAHQIADGDHRGAGQRFWDWGIIPWDDLPPDTQAVVTAHAVQFLGQLGDPDAVALDADALSLMSAPVLLSEGAQSREFARRIVERLAAVIPNAHRQVLPDAGHVPQMTHPGEYVEMVSAFAQ